MVSRLQVCQRTLVRLLQAVAAVLQVPADVTRESTPDAIKAACARVLRGARRVPEPEGLHDLKIAQAAWKEALQGKHERGRPKKGTVDYRIQATAVLLTYQSFEGLDQWYRFLAFARANLQTWQVKRWCATLETCKTGRLHVHLMLQFRSLQERAARCFTFEGICPNASSHDYLGEGISGRNPQQSVDRGFFYVFASKLGTARNETGRECVDGNYFPAWCEVPGAETYRVQGKWPEALWKQYKLADATYEEYIFLARDGVQARKRNLDACKAWSEARHEQAEIDEVVKRVRSNPSLYQAFPTVPDVSAWLQEFEGDKLRYPLLIVLGASASGKTEFAKSLFAKPLELKVGSTEVFPAKMVEFQRGVHDAIILDDVRDLQFLVSHQEKLQGKYDSRIEFATIQGGTCFFTKYLFRIPTVVTINFTTRNLAYLETNDWLCRPQNRVLVKWPFVPS